MIYKKMCSFIVEKANFKYLQERNAFFMISMTLYRFFDINLPIIYTIASEIKIKDEDPTNASSSTGTDEN